MIENTDELMEFFEGQYIEEVGADEIKKGVKEDLKSYAEEHQITAKTIMSAYALFKKYKSGKYSVDETNELSELSDAIDTYFSTTTV